MAGDRQDLSLIYICSIIVVLNNSKELREVTVPVCWAEVPRKCRMERLIYTYEEGYTTERDEYIVEDGERCV